MYRVISVENACTGHCGRAPVRCQIRLPDGKKLLFGRSKRLCEKTSDSLVSAPVCDCAQSIYKTVSHNTIYGELELRDVTGL